MEAGNPDDKLALIFNKYPRAGFAKTGLIPAVGAAGTAKISRCLSERCVRTVRSSGARAVVCCALGGAGDVGDWELERVAGGG